MHILHLTLINQSIIDTIIKIMPTVYFYIQKIITVYSQKILIAFTQNNESNYSDQKISQQKSFSP